MLVLFISILFYNLRHTVKQITTLSRPCDQKILDSFVKRKNAVSQKWLDSEQGHGNRCYTQPELCSLWHPGGLKHFPAASRICATHALMQERDAFLGWLTCRRHTVRLKVIGSVNRKHHPLIRTAANEGTSGPPLSLLHSFIQRTLCWLSMS